MVKHPQTKWAQRKDRLYITVEVVAPTKVTADFSSAQCVLRGIGTIATGGEEEAFEHTLNFMHTIEPQECTYKVVGNLIQIFVKKKESAPHWDRMLVEPSKVTKQWLSCDWAWWLDEEEEEEGQKKDPQNFGGYGDLSAMKNARDSDDDSDVDDEDLPPADLSDLDK